MEWLLLFQLLFALTFKNKQREEGEGEREREY